MAQSGQLAPLVNLQSLPYGEALIEIANRGDLTPEALKRYLEHVRQQVERGLNAVVENTCRPYVERMRAAGAEDTVVSQLDALIDAGAHFKIVFAPGDQ